MVTIHIWNQGLLPDLSFSQEVQRVAVALLSCSSYRQQTTDLVLSSTKGPGSRASNLSSTAQTVVSTPAVLETLSIPRGSISVSCLSNVLSYHFAGSSRPSALTLEKVSKDQSCYLTQQSTEGLLQMGGLKAEGWQRRGWATRGSTPGVEPGCTLKGQIFAQRRTRAVWNRAPCQTSRDSGEVQVQAWNHDELFDKSILPLLFDKESQIIQPLRAKVGY